MKSTAFLNWRTARLNRGDSIATVNNALAYLRALFNTLIEIRNLLHPSPVDGIMVLKKDYTELFFLTIHEIEDLLIACDQSDNPDTKIVNEICLATGVRWSEAKLLISMPTFTDFSLLLGRVCRERPEEYRLYIGLWPQGILIRPASKRQLETHC